MFLLFEELFILTKKILLTLITIGNLLALIASQYYDGLVPFYIQIGVYLTSCVIILFINSFSKFQGSMLSTKIEKIISNGKAAFFLSFLAVIDIIIFMMIVPTSSLNLLQQEYEIPFIFYALFVFLIPMALVKFSLESYGKEIENLFWLEYQTKIQTEKPSIDFALFILARIQLRTTPFQNQQPRADPYFNREEFSTSEISTTTYPLDYGQKVDVNELEFQNKNTLFDSNDELTKENVFDKYYKEIYQLIPEIEKLTTLSPIRIRPEMFLNVIIERTYKDPQMIQFFKNCT